MLGPGLCGEGRAGSVSPWEEGVFLLVVQGKGKDAVHRGELLDHGWLCEVLVGILEKGEEMRGFISYHM